MLYTIIEDFQVSDGDVWSIYIDWRGIKLDRFDSLDGKLRPSLFEPTKDEDWNHVSYEDCRVNYITSFTYACQQHLAIGSGSLMAFSYSDHDESNEGFLGYDIIDGYCDVSLLTNWGNDVEIVNRLLAPNALVPTYREIKQIYDFLIANYSDDNHVDSCRVISVYSTTHLNSTKLEHTQQVNPSPPRSQLL